MSENCPPSDMEEIELMDTTVETATDKFTSQNSPPYFDESELMDSDEERPQEETFPFQALPSCIHERFVQLQDLRCLHRLSQTCSFFYRLNLAQGKRAVHFLFVYTPCKTAGDSDEQEPHELLRNRISHEAKNGTVLRVCTNETTYTPKLFERLHVQKKLKMCYQQARLFRYVLKQINIDFITDLSITGIIHSRELFLLKKPHLFRAHLSLLVNPQIAFDQILSFANGISRISFWFSECNDIPENAEAVIEDFKEKQGITLQKLHLRIGKPIEQEYEYLRAD